MDSKSKSQRRVLAAKTRPQHKSVIDKRASPKKNGKGFEKLLMPELVAGQCTPTPSTFLLPVLQEMPCSVSPATMTESTQASCLDQKACILDAKMLKITKLVVNSNHAFASQ